MNKKTLTIISVALLFTVLVIVASFFIMKEKESKNKEEEKNRTEEKISKEIQEVTSVPSGETDTEDIISEEEIDTSKWKTYRNNEYGFEIDCPKDWTNKEQTEEQNKKEIYYMSCQSNFSRILMIPRGGLGHGTPPNPDISQVLIDGRKGIIRTWMLDNRRIYMTVHILDYPKGWGEENIIEYEGSEEEFFYTFIKKIQFN